MRIVVQHIEDCPNRQVALARLDEALAQLGLEEIEVRTVEVREADATIGFSGSPTFLVDGRDPFPGERSPVALSCRRYVTEHGADGAPSVHQLVDVLRVRSTRSDDAPLG